MVSLVYISQSKQISNMEKNDITHWSQVYELPLVRYVASHVHDSKDNFVFQFIIDGRELQDKIVDCINGFKNVEGKTSRFVYKEGFIQSDKGNKLLLIRGWGGLTGQGGYGLSSEQAVLVQNTFAEFIISRLNPEGVELI